MKSRKPQAKLQSQSRSITPENVAWWSLLAIPALVPIAVGMIPFILGSRFTYNMYVYPKVFTLAFFIAIALSAWATGIAGNTIALRTVPQKWPFLAFFGLATLSTVFAINPSMSFFGGRYLSVGMFVFLLAGAVYLLVTQLITSLDRVYALTWATVVGGLGVAVVGLFQVVGIDPIGISTTENAWLMSRGASLFGNSDFTGAYLVVPVVVALALGLSERTPTKRLVGLVSFGVLLAALVSTLTRGAWVGAFVGVIILLVASFRGASKVRKDQYWILGGLLVLPVAIAALNWKLFAERFQDLAAIATAGGGRLILWREALAVIAKHPLLGTGPDAYRLGWYGVRGAESVRLTGIATMSEDPHNVALLIGATIGIPALLAAVVLIVMSLVSSARSAFAKDAPISRRVLTGWWAALIGLCIVSVLTPNSIAVSLMLFLACAMLVAPTATETELAPGVVRALSGAALAFGVAALVIAGLTLTSDVRLMQAQVSTAKSQALAQAAAVAPWYIEAQDQTASEFSAQGLGSLAAGQPVGMEAARAAEARIRKLVAMNPDEYRSWAMLAVFYNTAGTAYAEDAFQQGITAASQAMAIYPINVEAANLKAFAQESQGDHAGAIETLKDVWDLDPRYFDSGKTYMVALIGDGQLEEAHVVLTSLQSRFPDNPEITGLTQFLDSQTKR